MLQTSSGNTYENQATNYHGTEESRYIGTETASYHGAETDGSGTETSTSSEIGGEDSGEDPAPLEAVRGYIRHGLAITPLKPRSKIAVLKDWPNRPLTTDQLSYYYGNGHDYNVGIICGDPSGRLIVIDFDDEEIYNEWAEEHEEITPTARTAKGRHLFYIWDIVSTLPGNGKIYFNGKLAGDIKGQNGYVVAPPSTHPDGHVYEWIISPDMAGFKTISDIQEIGLTTTATTQPAPGLGATDVDMSDRMAFYAEQIPGDVLDDACKKIIEAPDGEQNFTIRDHARNCFIEVYSGKRDRTTVYNALLGAGISGNHPLSRIKSTLESAETYAKKYVAANPPQLPVTPQKTEEYIFHTRTAAELATAKYPEPVWVVNGIIPQGLTMFTGPPKTRKSWFCLDAALTMATGGVILNHVRVESAQTLYLALEDNPRRLTQRINKIGLTPNENCNITTGIIPGKEIYQLYKWIEKYPNTKAIFIDTLARFSQIRDGNDYNEVTKQLASIKRIADESDISIIVVHHSKKSEVTDFIHSPVGSIAHSGVADTILVLGRKRGSQDAILNVTGRDVEEKNLALKFDDFDCRWKLEGDAGVIAETRERQEILDIVAESPEPITAARIAEEIGKKPDAVRYLIKRLTDDGMIERVSKGYTLTYTPK